SEDEHEIRLLDAPLKAEAAARECHENGAREVAARVSHHEDTVSTLATEEERNLGELRNDCDAISALQEPVGDVVEYLSGEEEASFLQRLRVCGDCRERERGASESGE